jgi:3',5'-cyclic AMP phosphodiesterase CpdA
MPGNHDEREAFRAAFADHAYLPTSGPLHFCAEDWPVRLVALDSTAPGRHHGDIDDAGVIWLEEALARDRSRPVLLAMHHHPFESGIAYLDEYRHLGAAAIGRVVAGQHHVERVLCGHVHRAMAMRFAGTIAMSCPSTASQIALRLAPGAQPASFMEPPGLLLHAWSPAKPMMTHHAPIGDFGQPMNFF